MAHTTLLQLRIPPELADRARLKMQRIMKAHEEEIEALTLEIKNCATEKQVAKLTKKHNDLHDRGRRITTHNVVRLAIDLGLAELGVTEALERVADEGIPIGRPRRVAE